ncbi:hypothetical protein BGZ65_007952 [Modicella reniformis]|uniref:Uncharacterized protein n=1 Tax=Modicella reniformis TaxID=1440133 RepID=A0A9P6IPU6_9FUNG|nr:hypothetical protein BGZ65_007952 [Modicella reniformis]
MAVTKTSTDPAVLRKTIGSGRRCASTFLVRSAVSGCFSTSTTILSEGKLMVMSGLADGRVSYTKSLKFVAKLRSIEGKTNGCHPIHNEANEEGEEEECEDPDDALWNDAEDMHKQKHKHKHKHRHKHTHKKHAQQAP